MSLAELVITSVTVEGRSKSAVAREYKVSRYWVHQLIRRYESEGEAAYRPRSRRLHGNPRAVGPQVEERIVRLRKELSKKGLDAGAETIRVHLQRDPTLTRVPAVSTIWRILARRGFVVPQPHKRPKSAGIDLGLPAPVVDRLVADVEIVRDARHAPSLGEQVENLASELSRVARSSHLDLLMSGTRIQKLRRRRTQDTPESPDMPGRFT